jgi:hypothetical protein
VIYITYQYDRRVLMEIRFNVIGTDRKKLVQVIVEILKSDVKYLGAPTFAYEVDRFIIDKNGTVSFDEKTEKEKIETLVAQLAEQGFIADPPVSITPEGKSHDMGEQHANNGNTTGLTITLPLDKVSVGNLTKLLDAKGGLIGKALGIPATPIEVNGDTVSFPWFDILPERPM